MIRVFYGENRTVAQREIRRQLGDGYEIIEAENLMPSDMASVFLGASLFGDIRAILVKDLSQNKECWEILPKFVAECTHNVVIWEEKLDKRSATYKAIAKDKNVEFKEFKLAENPNRGVVFDIFEMAFRGDGVGALKACNKITETNDPYMFMGLMVTQMAKKLQYNNAKAGKAAKILGQADIDMKTTPVEPWTIIKAALLKIAALR